VLKEVISATIKSVGEAAGTSRMFQAKRSTARWTRLRPGWVESLVNKANPHLSRTSASHHPLPSHRMGAEMGQQADVLGDSAMNWLAAGSGGFKARNNVWENSDAVRGALGTTRPLH
jgi:hypothetical protein